MLIFGLIFGLLLLVSPGPQVVWAQVDTHERDPESRDSEFKVSEPMVSLSAGAITEILRREPGLLLEVKRVLVRKAYEQGRLLDPADLGDDALFQLLREDANVRVLATEEIEKREYVRAKPTRRELEKNRIERIYPPPASTAAASGTDSGAQSESQEQKYWALHEQPEMQDKRMAPADSQLNDGFSTDGIWEPEPAAPSNLAPVPPSAQPSWDLDQRRRQSLAGLQPQDRDSYGGAPPQEGSPDEGSLPRIGPEAMPGLQSTSMDESDGPSQRAGAMDAPSFPPYSSTSPSPRFRGNWPEQPVPSSESLAASNAGPEAWSSRSDPRRQRPRFPVEDDHPVIRRRVNPYAEVPSLYDLYTQISRRSPVLARFGEEVFRNGTGNFDELPMDLPVGPDYVLGPGDGLSIELWGGISQRLQRVVDREGRVALPEAGAIQVTGRSLGDVQQLVQGVLRGQFRDVHADVSLARLRTLRVYVVGDVLRPGAYEVSSLSTPLNALYQAGGPSARGSMRILRVYRGQQLTAEIDLYDLLLHGVRSTLERLQAGDTILVPPLGAELTVEGMVRRPAIYELNHESDLAEALQLAGGVLNTGTLRHIEVERIVAHERRSMLRLDLPENDLPENDNQEAVTRALEDFKIQDGDKIRISPILPYSEQTVYLDGHVVHPGKHAYRQGMRITDLISAYTDLLPEPAERHAEIIRLAPPDYAPQVIAFNLSDALAGGGQGHDPAATNAQNVTLKPFETESSTTTLARVETICSNMAGPYDPSPTTRMSSFFDRMRNKASRSSRFSASKKTAATAPEDPETEDPETTVPIG
jgi:protein involved in polysaccharide export with SLBB domain